MNRRIDSVPPEEPGLIGGDRRVEHVDDSRLSRIRRIFRDATGGIMQGDIDSLREGFSELKNEILDFFRSEPAEEEVDERVVNAEVKAFYAIEGLKESNEKLSHLASQTQSLKDRVLKAEENEEEAKKDAEESKKDAEKSKKDAEKERRCGLTGLLNKGPFLERMCRRLDIFKREVHNKTMPVSMVFFDIDGFKRVNDTYGHPPGDEVISKIGRMFGERFKRGGDVTGKFGGDEFVMYLSNCDNENGLRLLEDFRKGVEALEFTAFGNGKTETFNLTISIGVFTAEFYRLNGKYEVVDIAKVLMKGADDELYKSKHNGKNCVTGASVDMETMDLLLKKEEEERKKRKVEKEAE